MSSLGKKRLDVVLAIAAYSVGSGTATATPTLGGEVPKQIVLTASDIAMYTTIWKIYFYEDLSDKRILEMLAELGLVTLAASGTAYIVAKATTVLVSKITSWLGPVGWGITAAIASSVSGLFGVTWALYCDHLYSQKESQVV